MSEDQRAAVGISVTLSGQLSAAALAMIAVVGAFTTFLVDKRVTGATFGWLIYSPSEYETKFVQVIDIESNRAKSPDAATEERALLRTHLERRCSLANGGRGRLRASTGPGPAPAGASPKRKIPGGSGDGVTRFLRRTQ
jgi:hypothetical protein